MSNDVYLIKKQTLDNVVFAVDDVVQHAGGLTPEEIVEKLDAIPRRQSLDCTVTNNIVRVPEGLFQDYCDVAVPTTSLKKTGLKWGTISTTSGAYVTGTISYTQPSSGWVAAGSVTSGVTTSIPVATRADTTLAVATNNANSIKITAANTQNTGYVVGAEKTAEMTVGLSVVQNRVTMGNNVNNITITKTVGTSVAGATYTPTTTDKVLAAGSYLTGAYTIKGDADLVASNIKSGVEIFGVTGTYEGGGSYLNAESYTF